MTVKQTQMDIAIEMLNTQIAKYGEERVTLTSTRTHTIELIEEINDGDYDVKTPTKRTASQVITDARKQLNLSGSLTERKKRHRKLFNI